MTRPRPASRPQPSPNASVSAGLREMFVTMNCKRTPAMLVANTDFFFGNNFSNAAEAQLRELFFPCIEQLNRIPAWQGKKQFEIFSITQGRDERGFGRDGFAG